MASTAPESRRHRDDGAPGSVLRLEEVPRRPGAMWGEAVIGMRSWCGMRAAAAVSAAVTAACLAGVAAAPAQQESAPPVPGWYTTAQAASGRQLFNNYCAECHRPDLTGADGPALKGAAFLKTFGGQPLSDLYGVEHTTMPAVNPGSLPDTTLLPITAFILSQNGFAAGDAPLDATTLSRTLPATP
jgi:mono/diheme cytochrome c family protein